MAAERPSLGPEAPRDVHRGRAQPSSSSSPTWPGSSGLAGALFVEQEKRADDPTLRAIFRTFVRDEVRHAQVAQMLADFYDVHHLTGVPPERAPRALHAGLRRRRSLPERRRRQRLHHGRGADPRHRAPPHRSTTTSTTAMSAPGDAPHQPRRVSPQRDRLLAWSSTTRPKLRGEAGRALVSFPLRSTRADGPKARLSSSTWASRFPDVGHAEEREDEPLASARRQAAPARPRG